MRTNMATRTTITSAAIKKAGLLNLASELRCGASGLAYTERHNGNELAAIAYNDFATAMKIAEDKFRTAMAEARLAPFIGK